MLDQDCVWNGSWKMSLEQISISGGKKNKLLIANTDYEEGYLFDYHLETETCKASVLKLLLDKEIETFTWQDFPVPSHLLLQLRDLLHRIRRWPSRLWFYPSSVANQDGKL